MPVFVSVPSVLTEAQDASLSAIRAILVDRGIEGHTLRKGADQLLPLKAVHAIATTCAGGLVLGYEQMRVMSGSIRFGTPQERAIGGPLPLSTPWNHLEAGILFALGLPLLIFREPHIRGGIFDDGVTDVLVHDMPYTVAAVLTDEVSEVIDAWSQAVFDRGERLGYARNS
jgi:hypothetical protein